MRYWRLYLSFVRFSFSRAMEFRVDFFFRVVMDIAYYAVSLAFFTVLYEHTTLLGGWDIDQVYIFVAGSMLVDALNMTVFANNLWWLPVFINKGDMDYYLVRPVSSLFFLSLRDVAANSFLNLIFAAGLVVWALGRYPEPLGSGRTLIFVLLLLLGTFLNYLIRLVFIIPVFWLHSNRGLDEIAWSLSKLSQRPHQIYHGWVRWVVITVLPLAFMSSLPAHVLFEGLSVEMLLHFAAVTGGFFLLALGFWRLGLRAYASASS